MKALEKVLLAGGFTAAAIMGGCAPEQASSDYSVEGKKDTKPRVSFVYVPKYLEKGHLVGKVENIDPKNHKVMAFIEVSSQWWVKPTWDSPRTTIRDDGMFDINIVTGGYDEMAERVYLVVVRNSYKSDRHSAWLSEGSLPKKRDDFDIVACAFYDKRHMKEEKK
jgi:hypothetical protein